MSQNPDETPDQSAGQGRSSGTPEPDPLTSSASNESRQSPYGESDANQSGSATSPYDSSDSGSSAYAEDSGSSTSPYSSTPEYQPPDSATGTSSTPSGSESYGQGQYGQGQSGAAPYGQSQYGQSGYDQTGGQTGYGQFGQQADPNYQYPPSQSQPYGQQAPGGYDPNAPYGGQAPGNPPQQYGQPGYPQYAGQAPVSEGDEKLWALLSHISIPFLGFIGPLIVYLIYKDRSPWLKDASTEALNFSILYSIATLVCSILTSVLIGLILLPIVFIGALIFCILAAMAANRHELYRYPINWRIIK